MNKYALVTSWAGLCFLAIRCPAVEPVERWCAAWGATAPATSKGEGVAAQGTSAVYVTGITAGAFDGQTYIGGQYDVFLSKYNMAGQRQWSRIWGTSLQDYGYGIAVSGPSNIYVTGRVNESLDGQPFAGGIDVFLTRWDQSGNKVWSRAWGSSLLDFGYGVATDSTGHVVVAGYTSGSFDGETNTAESEYDFFLTKYDDSGTKQWTRIWGSPERDRGVAVSVDSLDNVYVVGDTDGSFGGQTNAGSKDIALSKFGPNGQRLWSRIWGSTNYDSANAVCVSGTDAVYVAGLTKSSFDGQTHSGGVFDAFVTKWTEDGQKEWTCIWGGANSERAFDAAGDGTGSVYVTGTTDGAFDGELYLGGEQCPFVSKFTKAGVRKWTKIWGTASNSNDFVKSIAHDGRGSLYAAGATGASSASDHDIYLTAMADIDRDNDDLPDQWELARFGNMDEYGAGDYDGDRAPNVHEWISDTDPTNAADFFSISDLVVTRVPSEAVLEWPSSTARFYTVQFTAGLKQPWSNVADFMTVQGAGGMMCYTNSAPNSATVFYRLRVKLTE